MFKHFNQTLKREFARIFSRPIYILGIFGAMIFSIFFFTTLFKEGMPNKMPIAIVDLDQTTVSHTLIRNIDATQQAKVVMNLSNYSEARYEMQKGNIYAFVVIPKDFSKDAVAGKRPSFTFYINDSYLVAGSLLMKDITYMGELVSGYLKREILRKKGTPENEVMSKIQPIAIDTHMLGNPWTNYNVYLTSLLLPGVLQLMIIMMTVFAIGIELKERTSRQWVETAGGNMFVALTAKLLPYSLMFTLIGIVCNIILHYFLLFPIHTNIIWMFLATFLFVLANQAIGTFIIGVVPVLRDGVALAAFYGLLGFTFAGFAFPVEQIPANIQIFSFLFPIRFYFKIYANQALLGVPIIYSLQFFVALIIFFVLPIFIFIRLKKAAVNQDFPVH